MQNYPFESLEACATHCTQSQCGSSPRSKDTSLRIVSFPPFDGSNDDSQLHLTDPPPSITKLPFLSRLASWLPALGFVALFQTGCFSTTSHVRSKPSPASSSHAALPPASSRPSPPSASGSALGSSPSPSSLALSTRGLSSLPPSSSSSPSSLAVPAAFSDLRPTSGPAALASSKRRALSLKRGLSQKPAAASPKLAMVRMLIADERERSLLPAKAAAALLPAKAAATLLPAKAAAKETSRSGRSEAEAKKDRETALATASMLVSAASLHLPGGIQHSSLSPERGHTRHIPLPTEKRFRWALNSHKARYWGFTFVIFKRRGMYEPLVRQNLRAVGAPEELLLLAGVESNYHPRMLSRAGAVGMWQFIQKTAEEYGLEINDWKDERRHVAKATRAAGRYLLDLYRRFGQWELAIAAYNCGEFCIQRAVDNCPKMTFWQMRSRGACRIPQETRDYVARYFSLLSLYRHYPSDKKPIRPHEPIQLVEVQVPPSTRIHDLAAILELPVDELYFYNPELSSWMTPPSREYALLVPPEKVAVLQAFFKKPSLAWRIEKFTVAAKERLAKIAKQTSVPVSVIQEMYRIRSDRFKSDRVLYLPLPTKQPRWTSKEKKQLMAFAQEIRRFRWRFPALYRERVTTPCVRVRPGDTWKKIARRYASDTRMIMHYNRHRPGLIVGHWIQLRQWARCKANPPPKIAGVSSSRTFTSSAD